ncbi:MAG: DUF4381 family protein [Armatimonadetes bacterium]|nr:DUF4381 family protein [Armatimonadota bacterium]
MNRKTLRRMAAPSGSRLIQGMAGFAWVFLIPVVVNAQPPRRPSQSTAPQTPAPHPSEPSAPEKSGFPLRSNIRPRGIGVPAPLQHPPSAEGVTLRTSIGKTRVTIGDPIRYTLTVEADPGVNIVLPNLGANLGAFEIRDYDVQRSKVGKQQRWTAIFTVATYDTGKFNIPSVEVAYEANGKVGSLASQPVEVTVESVKPGEQADIRDIKPPAMVKLTAWDFRWLIATVVAVLAVVIALWWFLHRRNREATAPFALSEPPVPTDREALNALSDLERSDLLAAGKVKEFYTQLSEILRRYIERQFEIPALESTTREVMANMGQSDFDAEEVILVEALLNMSDLVKFAKLVPPPERGAQNIEKVRRLVVNSAQRAASISLEGEIGAETLEAKEETAHAVG